MLSARWAFLTVFPRIMGEMQTDFLQPESPNPSIEARSRRRVRFKPRRRPQGTLRPVACLLALVLVGHVAGTSFLYADDSEKMQLPEEQGTRIRELESEVTRLNQRVAELEAQLVELRRLIVELNGTGTEDPGPLPLQSEAERPAPAKPRGARRPASVFDNPASILEALKWDFRHDLAKDPSFALGIESTNELARVESAATLDSWIQRTNLSYRKSVTWPARILERGDDERSNVFTMQAVTPRGVSAGAPFTVALNEALVARIEGWQAQGGLDRVLMKGLFEAKLSAIELEESTAGEEEKEATERPAIGASGIEISPWVRLDYLVRVSSIMPIFERTTTPEQAIEEMTGDGS